MKELFDFDNRDNWREHQRLIEWVENIETENIKYLIVEVIPKKEDE